MTQTKDRIFRPILPIRNTVLYPKLALPLIVGRAQSIAAVEEANRSDDKGIVVLTQREQNVEQPKFLDLFHIGTEGIIRSISYEETQIQLTVLGLRRVRLIELVEKDHMLFGHFEPIPIPDDEGSNVEAQQRVMLEQIETIQTLKASDAANKILPIVSQFQDPFDQIFFITYLIGISVDKAQKILEARSREEALKIVNEFLHHEIEILKLRKKITTDVATEMTKEQREYYLRQQLKAIQTELGEDRPEQAEIKELMQKLKQAKLPENIAKEADRELQKLEKLPTAAPDYQLTRSYLDLICELPWRKESDDKLDLKQARKVLDEDHFNLNEVKDRIIEYLAVLKLNPASQAPIICFVGPPGVGKTSLGASIARAIGRKFDRISLGGLHDEAELRGHRRTYIGAMPGRIIQAIRRAGTKNPLLMLDEVDKLGRDFRGDPSAALMEILDPSQNNAFKDNYLDLPFDLSRVFFIMTANVVETIPEPLLDRMETIRLSGYTETEKLYIAKKYLIPRQFTQAGIPSDFLDLSDDVILHIIRKYTREGGLRELERMIGKLTRKAAITYVEGSHQKMRIETSDLVTMLGPERFFMEQSRSELVPGIAVGVAYTPTGGDVLYIEAAFSHTPRELRLTGSLGDVMKESANAALTYIWSRSNELGISQQHFKKSGIHIHVPAGSTPKDGPSAGVTIATALVSLLTGKAARSDTAMTGEITLSGLVLPIGGLKEKCLAAKRAGIKRVIIPKDNEKDLRDLPEELKESLEIKLVSNVLDVIKMAIPDLVYH